MERRTRADEHLPVHDRPAAAAGVDSEPGRPCRTGQLTGDDEPARMSPELAGVLSGPTKRSHLAGAVAPADLQHHGGGGGAEVAAKHVARASVGQPQDQRHRVLGRRRR